MFVIIIWLLKGWHESRNMNVCVCVCVWAYIAVDQQEISAPVCMRLTLSSWKISPSHIREQEKERITQIFFHSHSVPFSNHVTHTNRSSCLHWATSNTHSYYEFVHVRVCVNLFFSLPLNHTLIYSVSTLMALL